jgi:hypothetical protein
MKNLFSISAIAIVILGGAQAAAAELPTFELMGLPMTPHQVAVLGGGTGVQEQAPAPALMLGGMPASPHQVAVLTSRLGAMAKAAAVKPTSVGVAAE